MKMIFFLLSVFYFKANSIYAQCSCGSSTDIRWSGLTVKKNITGPEQKITCGHQFALTCKDTLWTVTGRYSCVGTCSATYKVNISRGSALMRTIDAFSLTSGYLTFSEPGNYKAEIRPNCGGTSCRSCYLYFSVNGAGCRVP